MVIFGNGRKCWTLLICTEYTKYNSMHIVLHIPRFFLPHVYVCISQLVYHHRTFFSSEDPNPESSSYHSTQVNSLAKFCRGSRIPYVLNKTPPRRDIDHVTCMENDLLDSLSQLITGKEISANHTLLFSFCCFPFF